MTLWVVQRFRATPDKYSAPNVPSIQHGAFNMLMTTMHTAT